MKLLFPLRISSFVFISLGGSLWGQVTPANMGSTTSSSSKISNREYLEPLKQQPQESLKQTLPTPLTPPKLVPQQANYLHPGILVYLNGKWEGSDHLLNLTPNIGIYVSIIKPENEAIDVTDAQVKKEVESILVQANIKPQTLAPEGKPPLPAFEIEIFVYPIEGGFVAHCEGRLFESVVIERFKMDPNMAFQAITWEKQRLFVSPTSQFSEELTTIVRDIATAFAERFQIYEKIKKNVSY